MKAFILAAGMGMRLQAMTKNIPKALVEVNGMSMLERTIEKLKIEGIDHFMINIHHHGELVIDFLRNRNNFNVRIEISDETEELLDTGGALWRAGDFFKSEEPILIHNVDVISNVNLPRLLEYHHKNEAFATLCIRKRESSRGLLFDPKMNLVGWTNVDKDEFKWVNKEIDKYEKFAYSGIYLVDPDFTAKLPFEGRFSIIDAWLKMARSEKIIGYHDKSEIWFDLGTKEKIDRAEKHLKQIQY